MIGTLVGVGLCAVLFALFVGFVRPKSGGCSGSGSCGGCESEGHCSVSESRPEH